MSDTEVPHSRGVVRRPRVLLVDDDPALLRGLTRLLTQRHPKWELLAAQTAAQALGHLNAGAVDVLVTDLQMPEMDGLTLLAIARDRFPRTVRVIHSSQIGTIEKDELSKLAHRIISKPARAADISDVLNWALSDSQRVGNGA
jgi:DNA-binding NtrC family response regulator